MRRLIRTTPLVLTLLAGSASHSPLRAQGLCDLVTTAEIEKLTGRKAFDKPDLSTLRDGGTVCLYGGGMAQVLVFAGPNSQQSYNAFLKRFGRDQEVKHPVSGFGDAAYLMFPKPRNEYEDTVAALVIKSGQRTLQITVAAAEGQKGESVEPQVKQLAKLVLERLK